MTRGPPTDDFMSTPVGRAFIAGMMDNDKKSFWIDCSINVERNTTKTNQQIKGFVNSTRLSLVRRIFQSDLKKIEVTLGSPGRIKITKTDNVYENDLPLQPWNTTTPNFALRVTDPTTRVKFTESKIVENINKNAQFGYLGPGTYWCRDSLCTQEQLMTSRNSVKWGPSDDQVIHLDRRFTCCSNDVVYLIYCQRCLDEGNWASYVGESNNRNFHKRMNGHADTTSDRWKKKYPSIPELRQHIDRVLGRNGEEAIQDKDLRLKNVNVHFNFVHHKEDRRYTIIEGGFSSDIVRKDTERQWIQRLGYRLGYNNNNGTGNLNSCS
ncbi:uncharacterized protein LOC118434582 [Folsomia candida]|uniref:tRNA(Ile)-lysidine synthase n=1 Tax=Folsomia candida TaxID=158441 RepID=A0A226ES71_FOLCA|nr:uncharacterized protein LOC118434582 [Folsomia candida]OXA59914.1 tRNA(Ile)-lysidine synthase [Folsomia candida]